MFIMFSGLSSENGCTAYTSLPPNIFSCSLFIETLFDLFSFTQSTHCLDYVLTFLDHVSASLVHHIYIVYITISQTIEDKSSEYTHFNVIRD